MSNLPKFPPITAETKHNAKYARFFYFKCMSKRQKYIKIKNEHFYLYRIIPKTNLNIKCKTHVSINLIN